VRGCLRKPSVGARRLEGSDGRRKCGRRNPGAARVRWSLSAVERGSRISWQHTRGSALLGWVGDDAEFIAEEMEAAAGPETAAKVTNYEHEGAPMPRPAGALEGV
jgi:hypothetical protein